MCGQVGDTFLSFVCFVFNMSVSAEPICLFCLGKGLKVGVVSVAVNMRRN